MGFDALLGSTQRLNVSVGSRLRRLRTAGRRYSGARVSRGTPA